MTNNWKEKVGGMIPSKIDPRDYKMTYGAMQLPKTYKSGVDIPIHNQGKFSNCAAHALAEYIEMVLKSKGIYKKVSFPWYYGDRNYSDHKDEGLVSRDLLKAAQKDGGLYLSDYPKEEEMKQAMYSFDKNYPRLKEKAKKIRIGNYYQCTTVDEVKEAIYKYGSCMVGTLLFESFKDVATGKTLYMKEPIIDRFGSLEEIVGGHMMLGTSWIDGYFNIQNSWGEEFGDKGNFYMPFTLSTWNKRTGFPIPVFEAWAIDGVYLDDKFVSFKIDTPDVPINPPETNKWYKDHDKWKFKDENGKDAIGWKKINSAWYFFDNSAYMVSSKWVMSNYKWTYLKSDGKMAQNEWEKVDSRWYWFDENGYAITGWKNINGKDYYFAEKGFGKIKQCECMISCP